MNLSSYPGVSGLTRVNNNLSTLITQVRYLGKKAILSIIKYEMEFYFCIQFVLLESSGGTFLLNAMRPVLGKILSILN